MRFPFTSYKNPQSKPTFKVMRQTTPEENLRRLSLVTLGTALHRWAIETGDVSVDRQQDRALDSPPQTTNAQTPDEKLQRFREFLLKQHGGRGVRS